MSENSTNAGATRRPDGTHRVVITGMGAVSPAGVGVQALWDAVMGRACCIGPVTRFDTADYDVHIAAEVRDFDATEHGITKKEARRFERFVQYAIVASDEALAQSGLNLEVEDTARIACVFGTGIGGIDELQSGFFTLAEKGPKRVSPLFIPTMIGNIAAGNLSIRYGLRGECLNVVTACATGAHSIGAAVRDIRHGYIDAALAGGSEESVSPICLAGFANLGALSKADDPSQASLPFDARRAGFVAGEGAGAVVLESLEHALVAARAIVERAVDAADRGRGDAGLFDNFGVGGVIAQHLGDLQPLREILNHSSNVGISLATEQAGFDKLYDNIKRFHFTEPTGVDYPGEAGGNVLDFDNWAKITGYNVSFGQGIAVTPLQITRFYGALVNDGVEVTPPFLINLPQTGDASPVLLWGATLGLCAAVLAVMKRKKK